MLDSVLVLLLVLVPVRVQVLIPILVLVLVLIIMLMLVGPWPGATRPVGPLPGGGRTESCAASAVLAPLGSHETKSGADGQHTRTRIDHNINTNINIIISILIVTS